MSFIQINPIKIYEINGEECKVRLASGSLNTGGGANQVLIPGVAGKIYRIMGWRAQNISAVESSYAVIAPGGAQTSEMYLQAKEKDNWPIVDSGYFETGIGYEIRIYLTQNTYVNVFYILYTPSQ